MNIDDVIKHLIEIKEKSAETHTMVKAMREDHKVLREKQERCEEAVESLDKKMVKVEQNQETTTKVMVALPTTLGAVAALIWYFIK